MFRFLTPSGRMVSGSSLAALSSHAKEYAIYGECIDQMAIWTISDSTKIPTINHALTDPVMDTYSYDLFKSLCVFSNFSQEMKAWLMVAKDRNTGSEKKTIDSLEKKLADIFQGIVFNDADNEIGPLVDHIEKNSKKIIAGFSSLQPDFNFTEIESTIEKTIKSIFEIIIRDYSIFLTNAHIEKGEFLKKWLGKIYDLQLVFECIQSSSMNRFDVGVASVMNYFFNTINDFLLNKDKSKDPKSQIYYFYFYTFEIYKKINNLIRISKSDFDAMPLLFYKKTLKCFLSKIIGIYDFEKKFLDHSGFNEIFLLDPDFPKAALDSYSDHFSNTLAIFFEKKKEVQSVQEIFDNHMESIGSFSFSKLITLLEILFLFKEKLNDSALYNEDSIEFVFYPLVFKEDPFRVLGRISHSVKEIDQNEAFYFISKFDSNFFLLKKHESRMKMVEMISFLLENHFDNKKLGDLLLEKEKAFETHWVNEQVKRFVKKQGLPLDLYDSFPNPKVRIDAQKELILKTPNGKINVGSFPDVVRFSASEYHYYGQIIEKWIVYLNSNSQDSINSLSLYDFKIDNSCYHSFLFIYITSAHYFSGIINAFHLLRELSDGLSTQERNSEKLSYILAKRKENVSDWNVFKLDYSISGNLFYLCDKIINDLYRLFYDVNYQNFDASSSDHVKIKININANLAFLQCISIDRENNKEKRVNLKKTLHTLVELMSGRREPIDSGVSEVKFFDFISVFNQYNPESDKAHSEVLVYVKKILLLDNRYPWFEMIEDFLNINDLIKFDDTGLIIKHKESMIRNFRKIISSSIEEYCIFSIVFNIDKLPFMSHFLRKKINKLDQAFYSILFNGFKITDFQFILIISDFFDDLLGLSDRIIDKELDLFSFYLVNSYLNKVLDYFKKIKNYGDDSEKICADEYIKILNRALNFLIFYRDSRMQVLSGIDPKVTNLNESYEDAFSDIKKFKPMINEFVSQENHLYELRDSLLQDSVGLADLPIGALFHLSDGYKNLCRLSSSRSEVVGPIHCLLLNQIFKNNFGLEVFKRLNLKINQFIHASPEQEQLRLIIKKLISFFCCYDSVVFKKEILEILKQVFSKEKNTKEALKFIKEKELENGFDFSELNNLLRDLDSRIEISDNTFLPGVIKLYLEPQEKKKKMPEGRSLSDCELYFKLKLILDSVKIEEITMKEAVSLLNESLDSEIGFLLLTSALIDSIDREDFVLINRIMPQWFFVVSELKLFEFRNFDQYFWGLQLNFGKTIDNSAHPFQGIFLKKCLPMISGFYNKKEGHRIMLDDDLKLSLKIDLGIFFHDKLLNIYLNPTKNLRSDLLFIYKELTYIRSHMKTEASLPELPKLEVQEESQKAEQKKIEEERKAKIVREKEEERELRKKEESKIREEKAAADKLAMQEKALMEEKKAKAAQEQLDLEREKRLQIEQKLAKQRERAKLKTTQKRMALRTQIDEERAAKLLIEEKRKEQERLETEEIQRLKRQKEDEKQRLQAQRHEIVSLRKDQPVSHPRKPSLYDLMREEEERAKQNPSTAHKIELAQGELNIPIIPDKSPDESEIKRLREEAAYWKKQAQLQKLPDSSSVPSMTQQPPYPMRFAPNPALYPMGFAPNPALYPMGFAPNPPLYPSLPMFGGHPGYYVPPPMFPPYPPSFQQPVLLGHPPHQPRPLVVPKLVSVMSENMERRIIEYPGGGWSYEGDDERFYTPKPNAVKPQ